MTSPTHPPYRRRRRRPALTDCHCCQAVVPFCWTCRQCGFAMCQACMDENFWGLSCNGITWVCPDCGASNGYGNQ
ncbi:MAG: hypothetical protein HF981_17020 [Desulfobacteraceae bacterium]|nr:hypothetical protein [Desulfobacteraceae bacterium]MBC2752094.1 hypothetical protein [Desulfobacteraceae bacterium]